MKKYLTIFIFLCFTLDFNEARSEIVLPTYSEIMRTYNDLIESEAYGSAAALVPYKILKHMIEQGNTYEQISETLGVSYDLVKFRLKVICLYKKYNDLLPGIRLLLLPGFPFLA